MDTLFGKAQGDGLIGRLKAFVQQPGPIIYYLQDILKAFFSHLNTAVDTGHPHLKQLVHIG